MDAFGTHGPAPDPYKNHGGVAFKLEKGLDQTVAGVAAAFLLEAGLSSCSNLSSVHFLNVCKQHILTCGCP